MDIATASIPLLTAGEAAPCTVLNAESNLPLLLVCDHASQRLPLALGDLGVTPAVLDSHLGWDIGAADVTRHLAARLQATAVLGGYSRLVVDLNRNLHAEDAFLTFSDGVAVAGNRNLSESDKRARVEALYRPYHAEVQRQLERVSAQRAAVLVSIHSFTPVFEQQPRPWHIGVLWNEDPETANRFLDGLAARGHTVGNNKPYSGKQLKGYTLAAHAEGTGHPHVLIELRQDLLGQPGWTEQVVRDLEHIIRQLPTLQPQAPPDDT